MGRAKVGSDRGGDPVAAHLVVGEVRDQTRSCHARRGINLVKGKIIMRLCCVIILISILAGCSYIPKLDEVLPDKRTEYKKSESLPGLEVPPDLTTARGEGAMGIPGEAPLSEYKRQEAGLDTPQGAVAGGGVIA